MSLILDELKYSDDHEWVRVEGNEAVIGITDYAQDALGNIVYVELPEVGTEYSAGDSFAVIESVKAASDAYMPISGTVVASNGAVVDGPELLNQDAFANWMIRVTITDPSQLDGLLSADDYRKLLGGE